MEINEIHSEYEHATTSLKVVLLVFAIVLVGALAYLVWAANTAPDTTDNSAVAVKTSTAKTVTVGDKTTFTDSELGFSISYPKTWQLKKRSGIEGYYDGYSEMMLKQSVSTRDADWGITVTNNTTVASRVAVQRDLALSYTAVKATDLTEGVATVGSETATTFSFKQDGTMRMFYFFAKGSTIYEIVTDGSVDQTAIAKTFTFAE